MRIYMFKSETTKGLRAFASDLAGSKLPANHGPWSVTGVVREERAPPHNLSRGDRKSHRGRGISAVAAEEENGSDGLSLRSGIR